MRADIKESLDQYAENGRPTGDFLRAVLENDFFEACGRADEDNARDLKEIASYIYNELPGNCHGNSWVVSGWIEKFKKQREGRASTAPSSTRTPPEVPHD